MAVQPTPEMLNNPEAFEKFQKAQDQLTVALRNLMGYTEAYPQLKSDANFRDLQAQLEGTENRITVARNRYISAVRTYNTTVRSFPTNLTAKMFDYQVRPSFTVANEQEISTAPRVDFGSVAHPPPGAGGTAAAPPASPPPASR
jgi:LemA protein